MSAFLFTAKASVDNRTTLASHDQHAWNKYLCNYPYLWYAQRTLIKKISIYLPKFTKARFPFAVVHSNWTPDTISEIIGFYDMPMYIIRVIENPKRHNRLFGVQLCFVWRQPPSGPVWSGASDVELQSKVILEAIISYYCRVRYCGTSKVTSCDRP